MTGFWPFLFTGGQAIFHIALHFLLPAAILALFDRQSFAGREYFRKLAIMLSAMLVDLDHLLADPIYDPSRCSIGFHPLHGFFPVLLYFVLCFIPKLRLLGLGLLIHMLLDGLDCYFMPAGPEALLDSLPWR